MTKTTTEPGPITAVLDRPQVGRPWWQRWTVIGLIFFGMAQGAETAGVVPVGFVAQLTEFVKLSAGMLTTLGIYRHVANE